MRRSREAPQQLLVQCSRRAAACPCRGRYFEAVVKGGADSRVRVMLRDSEPFELSLIEARRAGSAPRRRVAHAASRDSSPASCAAAVIDLGMLQAVNWMSSPKP